MVFNYLISIYISLWFCQPNNFFWSGKNDCQVNNKHSPVIKVRNNLNSIRNNWILFNSVWRLYLPVYTTKKKKNSLFTERKRKPVGLTLFSFPQNPDQTCLRRMNSVILSRIRKMVRHIEHLKGSLTDSTNVAWASGQALCKALCPH